jgi:hypothetical protein
VVGSGFFVVDLFDVFFEFRFFFDDAGLLSSRAIERLVGVIFVSTPCDDGLLEGFFCDFILVFDEWLAMEMFGRVDELFSNIMSG